MNMGSSTVSGFSRRIRVGFIDDPVKIQGIYASINVLRQKGIVAISATDFGILEVAKQFGKWGGDGNRSIILYISDSASISHIAEWLQKVVEWFEILEWKVDDDK